MDETNEGSLRTEIRAFFTELKVSRAEEQAHRLQMHSDMKEMRSDFQKLLEVIGRRTAYEEGALHAIGATLASRPAQIFAGLVMVALLFGDLPTALTHLKALGVLP